MKKIVALAAAAGIVAAGVALAPSVLAAPSGQGQSQQVAEYQPPAISWGSCADFDPRLVSRGGQCGFVEVPLDYDHPNGTHIKIAVSRLRHTTADSAYQGPVLVNPGGPGGSGIIYSVFRDFVPPADGQSVGAGESYDWIGFDPRGVGHSQPSLSCIPDYAGYNRPYYNPVTPSLEQAWLNRSKAYADACKAAQPELIKHLTTIDSAKDMDSIRKALGERQINYYGFSYGTYLGSVYGTLFPKNFRRVIFDGTVDPRGVWYQDNIDQDIAFDKNIKVYFQWIADHNANFNLGTTEQAVEKKFYTVQTKLIGHPADGKIGPDEWTDIFLQAGYYVYGWVDVADAFSRYVNNGEVQPLIDLYGSPPWDDNGYAMYLGVQCIDVQWPTNWNFWRIDNWITFFKAPFETWGNAWFNAPCIYWGAKAQKPTNIDGKKVQSVLMIGETNDAATPFPGSIEIRKRFPGAVLIEGVGGTTHAGSLSGVECTDSRIANYLATGALPARKPGNVSDVQCDPVPAPEPTPAAVAKTQSKVAAGASDNAALRKELQAGIGRG